MVELSRWKRTVTKTTSRVRVLYVLFKTNFAFQSTPSLFSDTVHST